MNTPIENTAKAYQDNNMLHRKEEQKSNRFRPTAFREIGQTGFLLGFILITALQCSSEALAPSELTEFRKAQDLYAERKFDEARAILIPLLDKHDDSPEIAVLLARSYFFTRDFQKSEETLRRLIKERKNSPYALLWLGRVVASDPQRQTEAAEIFRSVLREDPENHTAHYYLGRCLESEGKIEEALLSYQRAVAVEYQLSKMHLHMGTVFQGLHMEDRASRHFRRVEQLNLYPDDIVWVKNQKEPGRIPEKSKRP